MMLKRNEGYALSYVLVVLLVLCGIAIAVMSISLHNLKNQQASIDRMVDKYAAQGLVEQVVAQLEHSTTNDFTSITDNDTIDVTITNNIISLNVSTPECTITASLEATKKDDTSGYNVRYISYDVSYTSPNEGGGE